MTHPHLREETDEAIYAVAEDDEVSWEIALGCIVLTLFSFAVIGILVILIVQIARRFM